MIIVKLIGGLGNQMFQYAIGRNLAIKNNTELKLDITDYEKNKNRIYVLSNFNIAENFASLQEIEKFKKKGFKKILDIFRPYYKRSEVIQIKYDFDRNILDLKNNVYLNGYWQNERYFYDIADNIKNEFTLKKPMSVIAQKLSEKIKKDNSISMHVRKGDYIENQKFSKIYNNLEINYYLQAAEIIKKKIDDPFIYIFTDDTDWTEKNLSLPFPNLIVSRNKMEAYEELILMSQCRHNIIANSTFSWWGAWLNRNSDKIVIAPKTWFKIPSYNEQFALPEKWIKINNN